MAARRSNPLPPGGRRDDHRRRVRRPAPRGLDSALTELTLTAAPATLLARVQACWGAVVGEAVAREAVPISERAGTVSVACRSATWAQELTLLAPDLRRRLNASLGGAAEAPIAGLKFRPDRAAWAARPT